MCSAEELHAFAREEASRLIDPDKKHLRFNEIIDTALLFYPNSPRAGVRELIRACDRKFETTDGRIIDEPLYVKGEPMWACLNRNFRWML